jgi:hypothetical protein
MAAGINTTGNKKAIDKQIRADEDWNAYYPQLKAEFAKYGITIDPSIRLVIDNGNLKAKNGGISYARAYVKDPVTKQKSPTPEHGTPAAVLAENWLNPEYRQGFYDRAITNITANYANQFSVSNPSNYAINKLKADLDSVVNNAYAFGIDYETIKTSVNTGIAQNKKKWDEAAAHAASQGSWMSSALDTFFEVAEPAMNIGLAYLTGGLSLIEQIAINAAYSLAKGADVETILKNSLSTLATSQIPSFLDKIGATVTDPQVQAVIDNMAKQVTNAAIQGQDLRNAALGGLAGGITAQGLSSTGLGGTDYNSQISRAAGEYVQAKTAGLSEEQALTKALTGFVSQSEKEKAREQVLQRAEAGTYTDPNKGIPREGTSEFRDMQERQLPTVEVVDRFQPTQADKLSLTDQGKQAQVGEKGATKNLDPRYRILLSILNQPSGTSQFTGGTSGGQKSSVTSTGQGASPGTSALAQALKTDSGETIIAGDKGGRRKGWNLESLRYMGNSGG